MAYARKEIGGGDVHNFQENPVLFIEYRGATEQLTKFGPKLMHVGRTKNGAIVKFWGKGMLNSRLEGHEGDIVEIQFTGQKVPVKNGNAWEYKVFQLENFPSDDEIAEAAASI